tara:strand:+ start:270 stop:626 length:357 start_codon:yes stop_codon:yes gene_type:complete
MKFKSILISIIFIFIFIACESDSDPASSTVNCTDLIADATTKSETFMTAYMASFTSGEAMDSAICSSYVTSLQAVFDGGCEACEADDEACLDDGSNEDTCCDELTQAGIDEVSAMCGS